MSKLSKHQKRRIAAQHEEKRAQADIEESALVVAHLGYQIIVQTADNLMAADWRKQTGTVCVNDRVHLSYNNDGSAVVESIYPRGNTLYKWQGRKAKPIASHLDQLLIVIALAPEWQSALIDRYLIAAKEAGINAAILCNKIDLAQNDALETTQKRLSPYQEMGIPCFYASIEQKINTTPLADWINDKQTILAGQSGVGKSSFIQHFIPNADIWIQNLSHATGLGKHTTTNVRRYPLGEQGALIDTPGVRGYAVAHLTKEAILAGFPDIAHYASECKFNDCKHQNEPQCHVNKAIAEGLLSQERLNSLHQLLSELPER